MSKVDNQASVAQCLHLGAVDYLVKPLRRLPMLLPLRQPMRLPLHPQLCLHLHLQRFLMLRL